MALNIRSVFKYLGGMTTDRELRTNNPTGFHFIKDVQFEHKNLMLEFYGRNGVIDVMVHRKDGPIKARPLTAPKLVVRASCEASTVERALINIKAFLEDCYVLPFEDMMVLEVRYKLLLKEAAR